MLECSGVHGKNIKVQQLGKLFGKITLLKGLNSGVVHEASSVLLPSARYRAWKKKLKTELV